MQPIKVKCPKCQYTFGVASKTGKEDITATCPNCLSPIHVLVKSKPVTMGGAQPQPSWQPQAAPSSVETQYKPAPSQSAYQPQPQYQPQASAPQQSAGETQYNPNYARPQYQPTPQPRPMVSAPQQVQPSSGETQYGPTAANQSMAHPYANPAAAQPAPSAKPFQQNFMPPGSQPRPAQPKVQLSQAQKNALFGQNDPRTQYQPQQAQHLACPMLVVNGREYRLNVGRNTVGRKAHTSTSLIQIETDDRYMSRTNAIIEVYQVQGGWQVCVSSYTENNLVKINNLSIPMGDRIILLSGMTLTMGHTTMQFVIK